MLTGSVVRSRKISRPVSADGTFGALSKRGRHTAPFPQKRPISILPVLYYFIAYDIILLEGGCSFWRPFSTERSIARLGDAVLGIAQIRSIAVKSSKFGNFLFFFEFPLSGVRTTSNSLYGNFCEFEHFCAVGRDDARQK